jgi:hypothetical protein
MKLSKEFLADDLWWKDHFCLDILPRWSVDHLIFEHDGRFYQRFYSVGATEGQDERLTFLSLKRRSR